MKYFIGAGIIVAAAAMQPAQTHKAPEIPPAVQIVPAQPTVQYDPPGGYCSNNFEGGCVEGNVHPKMPPYADCMSGDDCNGGSITPQPIEDPDHWGILYT